MPWKNPYNNGMFLGENVEQIKKLAGEGIHFCGLNTRSATHFSNAMHFYDTIFSIAERGEMIA